MDVDKIKKETKKIRWDLSDLYQSLEDPKLLKDLKSCEKAALTFSKKYKGKMTKLSTSELKKSYQALEKLITPLYKIGQYLNLLFATNTTDDKLKALLSKVDIAESEISNNLMFFDLELGTLSKSKAATFLKDKALAPYSYALKQTVETSQYDLDEKEEKIINYKDITGVSAFKKLYEEFTTSFEYDFTIDGKTRAYSGDELRSLRTHKTAEVRRRAMKTFYKTYEDNQLIFTHIYNNVVRDYAIEKNLRGYKTAIGRRNIAQDLPEKAVEALHDVTNESYPLVQKYYKIKKKLLKLPKLTLADIYAPLPQSTNLYSFKEAKEIVLDGFSNFDEEFYRLAKMMFDENRVDVPVIKNKRGGAFCSGSTPDVKPYVLLNYLGKPRDISTLAHEFGHAIHDVLASKQVLTNYHPILPLAETASVFCEMIITDMLLEQVTDPLTRQAIITDKIEDMFATSHRQNMFSQFERKTHKQINEQIMSTDELCKAYMDELQLMFGKSVTYTPEYKWEWATIPHIFEYPFYVYAYNFGNLLVLALYQQYKEEGKAFIPKLKQILAAGSSKSPQEILSVVGIDITKRSFWKQSLGVVQGYLGQLG